MTISSIIYNSKSNMCAFSSFGKGRDQTIVGRATRTARDFTYRLCRVSKLFAAPHNTGAIPLAAHDS